MLTWIENGKNSHTNVKGLNNFSIKIIYSCQFLLANVKKLNTFKGKEIIREKLIFLFIHITNKDNTLQIIIFWNHHFNLIQHLIFLA